MVHEGVFLAQKFLFVERAIEHLQDSNSCMRIAFVLFHLFKLIARDQPQMHFVLLHSEIEMVFYMGDS